MSPAQEVKENLDVLGSERLGGGNQGLRLQVECLEKLDRQSMRIESALPATWPAGILTQHPKQLPILVMMHPALHAPRVRRDVSVTTTQGVEEDGAAGGSSDRPFAGAGDGARPAAHAADYSQEAEMIDDASEPPAVAPAVTAAPASLTPAALLG